MRCSRPRAGPRSESWTVGDVRSTDLPVRKPSIVASSNGRGIFGEVRLGDCGEPAVCPLLLVERLLQQPRFVPSVEPQGAAACRSVTGNFVMLDPLGDADDRRIADVGCRLLIQPFVGFL